MLRRIFSLLLLCSLAACSQDLGTGKQKETATATLVAWQPPAAGTVVESYKERVTEDNLNEKYFRVTVTATDQSNTGKFQLKLEYGFNTNETEIQLPEWNSKTILKPVLQKGKQQYHCLLGFDAGDGQFHELCEITAEGGNIRLKQTTGYYKTPQ